MPKAEVICQTCQETIVWGSKDGNIVKDIKVATMVRQPFKLQNCMKAVVFEKLEVEHKIKRKGGVLHIVR